MTFRMLCLICTWLSITLFAVLLLYPQLIYWIFAIPGHDSADLLARRAAILFLGIAVISWRLRVIDSAQTQHSFSIGIVVIMTGLAVLGLFEFARGFAGPGILLAVSTELAIAGAFAKMLRSLQA